MADYQYNRTDINPIGNEIKTSALMQVISEGATLDYTNADWPTEGANKVAVPGLAIARVASSGKWVPYKDAVAAFLATGVVGDNNAITFTAKVAETVKVQLLDPAGNDKALAVDVVGDTVVVSLATGPAGAITSTAAQVIAAVNAALDANVLVSAAGTGASTGAGVVAAVAATALADGSGAVYNDYGVLDEKVIFGAADQVVGQVLVLASVLEAACSGVTAAFKAKMPRMRFE